MTHPRTIYLDIGWVSSHLILLYSRTDGVVILCMYFESIKEEENDVSSELPHHRKILLLVLLVICVSIKTNKCYVSDLHFTIERE